MVSASWLFNILEVHLAGIFDPFITAIAPKTGLKTGGEMGSGNAVDLVVAEWHSISTFWS
jgi:hypothetical protein